MLLLEYGGCFVFHILVASYQLYDESGGKKAEIKNICLLWTCPVVNSIRR